MAKRNKIYQVVFIGFGDGDPDQILEQLADECQLPVDHLRERCTPGTVLVETADYHKAEKCIEEFASSDLIVEVLTAGKFAPANSAAGTANREGTSPRKRYADVACDDCGVILPKNETRPYSFEVESGRQGGQSNSSWGRSARTSSSTSSAGIRDGFSSGSTYRESASSGRTYFRTVHINICLDCLEAREAGDRKKKAYDNSTENAIKQTLGMFARLFIRALKSP